LYQNYIKDYWKKTTCVLCLLLGVQLNSRPLRLINYSTYSNLNFFFRRISVLKRHSSDLKRDIIVDGAANITSKNSSESDTI